VSTPTCIVLGELGIVPPSVLIKNIILNLWCNLVTSDEQKMSRRMYDYLYKQYTLNIYRSPWLVSVHALLGECGMGYLWDLQSVTSMSWFKNAVKLRLEDQYKQSWHSQVVQSPKCYNYRLYKDLFRFEKYLVQLPWLQRRWFCKFRTGNHKLAVEQGRYNNTERHLRFCNICDEQKLGDEYHFVMECISLDDLRNQYLPRYIVRSRNTISFTRLMSSESVRIKRKIAKFIIEGMKRIAT